MTDALVRVGGSREPLRIRINGPDATFHIATDRIAGIMLAEPEDVCLDLLDIACVIFAADGMVPRGGPTRPDMGADWRRHFRFEIPVRAQEIWSRADVQAALVDAVDCLMEDTATFRFVGRPPHTPPMKWLDFDPSGSAFQADEVVLFSGGLDSFSGTLERLETTRDRLVLVTHRSAQKTIPHQVKLGEWLAQRYGRRLLHIHVPAHRKSEAARESTQRSRSFLFAAVAQVIARLIGCERISFHENGIVSHNLPISAQVIGSMATRTTHPRSLRSIDTLHQLVLPGAASIQNRYAWLTKTEVVQRIAQHGGEEMIKHSVSCTHVRAQDTLHTHCAACSQCLDRRFAILAAGLQDAEPSEIYRFDVLTGARANDLSRTLAVDWTRHAREIAGMSPSGFLSRFAQDIARVIQGHNIESAEAVVQRMFALHQRHAKSVLSVLTRTFEQYAGDLAAQTIPATSLLVQHTSANTTDLAMPISAPPALMIDEIVSKDEVQAVSSGPSLPLRAQFFEDAKGPGVDILDVTTVRGQPARIVHLLRLPLEEDRAADRPRERHQYILSGTVAQKIGASKAAVRQDVKRCRRDLQTEWLTITGEKLSDHAFIQSGPSGGYRLAPDTVTSSR